MNDIMNALKYERLIHLTKVGWFLLGVILVFTILIVSIKYDKNSIKHFSKKVLLGLISFFVFAAGGLYFSSNYLNNQVNHSISQYVKHNPIMTVAIDKNDDAYFYNHKIDVKNRIISDKPQFEWHDSKLSKGTSKKVRYKEIGTINNKKEILKTVLSHTF